MTAKCNVQNKKPPLNSPKHIWLWKRLRKRCRRQRRHEKHQKEWAAEEATRRRLQSKWWKVW